MIAAATLAVVVGLALGALGGGGSILTVPLLLYVAREPDGRAIAESLLVVGATAGTAAIVHARRGNVDGRTAAAFAPAGMVGAYVGGRAAAFVPPGLLVGAFLLAMFATAIAMIRGRRGAAGAARARASLPVVLLAGAGVGAFSGLVGAGGGFLVVPALAMLAGLEMRRAVGTSLVVIALQSVAGFVGHLHHVDVEPGLTAVVTGAAVAGAIAGGALCERVPQAGLRRAFGGFVLAVATAMTIARFAVAV